MSAIDPVEELPVDVSVVILAHRMTTLLDRCLLSLRYHRSLTRFEVIVVANGATPEVHEVLARHSDITVITSRANRGFAGGCNLGASKASGKYLLFLNDDVIIHEGWIDALHHLVKTRPEIGAAGSIVLDPEGNVQEFGSLIDPDLVPSPLDRGITLAEARQLGTREVSYASACSLLIDGELYEQLGGFDEIFYPAYFEDPDLARRIWSAGRTVVATPFSVVTHEESASTTSAVRRVLFDMGREHFEDRWAGVPDPARGDLPKAGPRVVIFDDFVPRPASGSGLARSRSNIEHLTDLGLEVALCVRDRRFELDLELMARGVVLFDDPSSLAEAPAPVAIIASRPHNLDIALETQRHFPGVPLIYDAEARFSARLETRLRLTQDGEDRASLEAELAELLALERRAAEVADAIITISPQEADWFSKAGATNVQVLDPFPASCTPQAVVSAPRSDVVLITGWMAGPDSPNADGARWLIHEVMPHLRTLAPDVRISITGAGPPEELLRLADENLHFVGEVADLSGFLHSSRVALAPVRFGAGVKLKVVDALAHGVPVVSTTVGAEGLDPKWMTHIDVEDDPIAFARAIANLVLDDECWAKRRAGLVATCEAHQATHHMTWSNVLRMGATQTKDRHKR